MPTTLRSVRTDTKLEVEHEQEGTGILLGLACAAVLLLAALAIYTLPLASAVSSSDPTWLMGP